MSAWTAALVGLGVGFGWAWVWQAQRAFELAYWALKHELTPPGSRRSTKSQDYGGGIGGA